MPFFVYSAANRTIREIAAEEAGRFVPTDDSVNGRWLLVKADNSAEALAAGGECIDFWASQERTTTLDHHSPARNCDRS